MVQDWITLELAVRIRNAKGVSDISEAGKRKLRVIRRVLFAVALLVFLAFSTAVIVTAHRKWNYGYAFFWY